MNFHRNTTFWIALTLVLTALTYLPAISNGFVNWDDDFYVTGNNLIRSLDPAHLKAMFSQSFMGLYQPLVMLSLAFDYAIGGTNPLIFHLTNLFIHLLNTLLVFIFLTGLLENKRIAVIATLLFGLHPIHAEAVAWVTERKELLYAFFFLASLTCYVRFVKTGRRTWFWIAFVAFILSLLSKATAVVLPLVLILIDQYLDRKWLSIKLTAEKLLFIIPALAFGLLTLYLHRSFGSLTNASEFSIAERLFIAGRGVMYYLSKTVWPLDLSPYNQLPGSLNTTLVIEILFYWVLIAIAIYTIFRIRFKNRLLFFSAGFFVVTVFLFLVPPGVPVMVSERYAYIPSLGLFLIIASIFERVFVKPQPVRNTAFVILSAYLLFISVLTWQQAKVWKNSLSLWSHVIEVRGELFYPILQRGNAYRERGNYEKAMNDFNRAINLNPRYHRTYEKRGHLFLLLRDYDNAINDFNRASSLFPKSAFAHCSLGFAYRQTGDLPLAIEHLNRSIELDNDYADAWFNRGKTHLEVGLISRGCADLQTAITKGLTHEDQKESKQLIRLHCR